MFAGEVLLAPPPLCLISSLALGLATRLGLEHAIFKFSCERASTVIASFRDVFTPSGCSCKVKHLKAQPAGAPRPEGLLPAIPFLPGQGSGRLVGKGEGFMVPLRHPIHI